MLGRGAVSQVLPGRSACVSLRAPGPNDRLSGGGPATLPSTCYRVRVERPARPYQELTPRTNGAFAGSPGGTTAALTDHTSFTPAATITPPFAPGFGSSAPRPCGLDQRGRRAEALAHLVNTNSQYNHPPLAKKLCYAANRQELDLPARFTNPSVKKNVELDLALIDTYDEHIAALELYLTRTAKVDDAQAFARLRSVPGIGPVLGLVLLYEIHDIHRFPQEGQFLSYARLVRCAHESAGKKQGTGGNKIGNAHLKWAFSEATCLLVRASERAKTWLARREKKHGKKRALGALAARLGRAVYHLLRKGEAFDEGRFFAS